MQRSFYSFSGGVDAEKQKNYFKIKNIGTNDLIVYESANFYSTILQHSQECWSIVEGAAME